MDKKLGLLALIILLLTTAVLSSHSLIDLDIWLHCSSGHDILSNLSVTDVNSYSFTTLNIDGTITSGYFKYLYRYFMLVVFQD